MNDKDVEAYYLFHMPAGLYKTTLPWSHLSEETKEWWRRAYSTRYEDKMNS